MKTTVTDVRVTEGAGNLKAQADILLEDKIGIRGCSVMEQIRPVGAGRNRLFASLPKRIGKDGRWTDVVMIADKDAEKEVLDTIVRAYILETHKKEIAEFWSKNQNATAREYADFLDELEKVAVKE